MIVIDRIQRAHYWVKCKLIDAGQYLPEQWRPVSNAERQRRLDQEFWDYWTSPKRMESHRRREEIVMSAMMDMLQKNWEQTKERARRDATDGEGE